MTKYFAETKNLPMPGEVVEGKVSGIEKQE
jgi:hypothetical protein